MNNDFSQSYQPVENQQPVVNQQPTDMSNGDLQMNSMNGGDNQLPPELKAPKSKKGLVIVIVLVLLVALGVGGWFVYSKTDLIKKHDTKTEEKKEDTKKEEEPKKEEPKKEEEPKQEENANSKFNGRYKLNDTEFDLYAIGNNLQYRSTTSGLLEGSAEIKGDVATHEMFDDKYTFTIKEDGMQIEISDTGYDSGLYTKVEDLPKEKFFDLFICDHSLIDTQFNGHYKKDAIDLYLFRADENKVRVISQFENTGIDLLFDMNDDGTLSEKIFETSYSIKFNDDNSMDLTITTDDEDYKTFNGHYTFSEKLDMDAIIALIYKN